MKRGEGPRRESGGPRRSDGDERRESRWRRDGGDRRGEGERRGGARRGRDLDDRERGRDWTRRGASGSDKGGQRRVAGSRREGERPDRRPGERSDRTERVRPVDSGPELPDDLDLRMLALPVRAELRGLPADLADKVGAHLIVAGQLIDEEPELAFEHASEAKRRAARLPIVREALAEAAYAAEHYDIALAEMRALRRMTGNHDYLPVMADCERALGRPQAALKLAKESASVDLDASARVEMRIVEAGARADLGQRAEALRLLKQGIERRSPGVTSQSLARMQFAYAELLAADGDAVAETWYARAAASDPALEAQTERLGGEYRVELGAADDDESPDDESPEDDAPDDESPDEESPDGDATDTEEHR